MYLFAKLMDKTKWFSHLEDYHDNDDDDIDKNYVTKLLLMASTNSSTRAEYQASILPSYPPLRFSVALHPTSIYRIGEQLFVHLIHAISKLVRAELCHLI
jgi:hypothetical protein